MPTRTAFGQSDADEQVVINTALAGDTVLVAAVGGKTIRVNNVEMTAASGVTVVLKSAGNTKNTQVCSGSTDTDDPAVSDTASFFDCNLGEELRINLSAGVQVTGVLMYEIV